MTSLVIGIDFGSDSVRAVLVDASNGEILNSSVAEYERWKEKKYCDFSISQFRQHPLDYIEGLEKCVKAVVLSVDEAMRNNIRSISVDTTGSTPCPVNREGTPLSLLPEFEKNPNAMFFLWKDHTSVNEANEINEAFMNNDIMDYTIYQGDYSSEWYWAKILHAIRTDEDVKKEAYAWVEHSDWIPAILSGNINPDTMYRNRCASGHKAYWNTNFDGIPDVKVFEEIDEYLGKIARNYSVTPEYSTAKVGNLCKEWSDRLYLSEDVIVGGSSMDAHAGAVGSGIKPNTLVKVMGTSTVDMMVAKPEEMSGKDMKNYCGQAEGSIVPGYIGIEMGQAAFGDIFAWFKNMLTWPLSILDDFKIENKKKIASYLDDNILNELNKASWEQPIEENLISLDWFNGRRYPFINETVKGAFSGLTLGTSTVQMYQSIVFAVIFGSNRILQSLLDSGLVINEIIAVGGISKKSDYVMQTMSDVLKRPIKVLRTDQACALGSATHAAVAAGIYEDIEQAQNKMCSDFEKTYTPNKENYELYDRMYKKYLEFGNVVEEDLY